MQTLACSLILSRIDYCNAVLHDAPNCRGTPTYGYAEDLQ